MFLEILKLKRTYKNLNRIRQILNVFVKHGFGQFVEQLNLHRLIPFSKRLTMLTGSEALDTTLSERLRIVFAELGSSFIKLGQLLSSRPDLITDRLADEFKKLQDEIPPFPFDQCKEIIEENLKAPIDQIFSSIDKQPIAAASIAQVHKAILINGDKVVIKIQRPKIKEIIETDVSIMKTLAELMLKYIPESTVFNPRGIVDEFAKTITKELNFQEERRNIERFTLSFKHVPSIKIPKVYSQYSSDKVLTMEQIEGSKLDDIQSIERKGLDRQELAKTTINAYFKMMLEDGFFHADPHPGNLFALDDGRVSLVDFGIVGWLTPEIMESIATVLISLVNKDFDSLIDQFIALGMVTDESDLERFRQEFMADIVDFLVPLYDLALSEINYAEYLDTITRLAIKHNLKVPSSILLMNKCNIILDGIVRGLDPEFNFINIATPYATRLIRKRYGPKRVFEKFNRNFTELSNSLITIPRQIRLLLRQISKDELNIKLTHIGMESLKRDIDRSTNRLSFSIVIASIIMSSSVLTMSETGGKIFDIPALGVTGFIMAFILGVWLLISILRSGRM